MTVPIVKKGEDKGGQFASVFRWHAETQGYEWIKGTLVARQNPHPQARYYSPDKNLYRIFAELRPSRKAIQEFANEFGSIGGAEVSDISKKGVFGSLDQLSGLTLTQWKSEIGRLREFVFLWDEIRKRNARDLKRMIGKHRDGGVFYKKGVRYRLLASQQYGDRNLLNRYDSVKSALHALRKEINVQLSRLRVVPRLVWCPGPVRDYRERPTPDHHLRMVFFPSDLLGGMWLQFAQDVAGKHELSSCSECGNPLQTGPGGWKRGTKTCGARCRKARSRRLKENSGKDCSD